MRHSPKYNKKDKKNSGSKEKETNFVTLLAKSEWKRYSYFYIYVPLSSLRPIQMLRNNLEDPSNSSMINRKLTFRIKIFPLPQILDRVQGLLLLNPR